MSETIKDRIDTIRSFYKIGMNKFETKCGLSHGYLFNLKGEIGTSKLLSILTNFPDIDPWWLLTGAGEMLKREGGEQSSSALVPDLPLDAAAGFTDDVASGITPSMCSMLPRIPGLPPYDLTIAVRGDSMDPTFESGDRLAIRRCFDIIEWGAPHVLDTTEGVYVKRIKESDQAVVCISDNSDYPQFLIPKACIRGIYKVVALLRVC